MTEILSVDRRESGNPAPDLALVVVPLLKGVVYRDEQPGLWNSLLQLQGSVQDYVAVIGLELIVDEAEGYTFLRSRPEIEEDGNPTVPRLIARRQLSYPVSLLLALLRKKLAELDAQGAETRLILSREEVVELIRIFLPAGWISLRVFLLTGHGFGGDLASTMIRPWNFFTRPSPSSR